jgi:hypothetical protein
MPQPAESMPAQSQPAAIETGATPAPARAKPRASRLTTASIASFSLTLLAGGLLVLSGLVPLPLSFAERLDVGALLFVAPLMALVLALVFEVSRIALTQRDLPEPRRQRAVRWTPGRREG